MAPDLHKLRTKGKAPALVASAPDARYVRPWLRLPRPADVVDAHAPGIEVDAHAHDVEAHTHWHGAVGRERTAHAERRPVRDDVLVDERLEVVERHLEALHGNGQHGDGDGKVALLQARFLFDKCIIKREYAGGDTEGRWSLKELQRTSKKGHHYRNTRFKQRWRERGTTSDRTNREVLMLESCLRVSYTSPKVMHWITELLCALVAEPDLSWSYRFASFVNDYARKAVQEWLVAGDSAQGVNTPHVVLNYLDYLLWRGARKDDFDFEFRTSVEHWYPQNPSDDTFVRWGEVDRFGNLCLVQRNVNSKFSNLNPVAKKSTYQEMIAGGSLKLREMAQLTDGVDSWKGGVCQRHEEEMLALLREACGVDVLVEAD